MRANPIRQMCNSLLKACVYSYLNAAVIWLEPEETAAVRLSVATAFLFPFTAWYMEEHTNTEKMRMTKYMPMQNKSG